MPSPNHIQAVLFDLDGTLRHNRPDGFESFVEYLEELGHSLSLAQLQHGERWTHYYWSVSPELWSDLEEFGGETNAFWRRHAERQLRALGIPGNLAELAEQISQRFDERYQPDNHIPDDVVPTLRRLRSLGYTLGLVSNRTDPLDGLVLDLGLADLFHFTLSAGQAESRKPSAAIFLKAAALAGCPPEATVYVGDNLYADVEGARAAGLRPVLIDPRGIFPEPGCPVIGALSELERALDSLGTKSEAQASVS